MRGQDALEQGLQKAKINNIATQKQVQQNRKANIIARKAEFLHIAEDTEKSHLLKNT